MDMAPNTDTSAYHYIDAKLLANYSKLQNAPETLPTDIALTGLEKHRHLTINAESNPKTIEDADKFEAASQAVENFKDQQKCDLEMLINGPDGVLVLLNGCIAALDTAEEEIGRLRSMEEERSKEAMKTRRKDWRKEIEALKEERRR